MVPCAWVSAVRGAGRPRSRKAVLGTAPASSMAAIPMTSTREAMPEYLIVRGLPERPAMVVRVKPAVPHNANRRRCKHVTSRIGFLRRGS